MAKRPTIDAPTLRRRLASASPPLVVAVATAAEHRRACIPGSRLLGDLEAFVREVPTDRVIVLSARGPGDLTASWAYQLLLEQGYRDVTVLRGGLHAWEAAGNPVEHEP